MINVHTVLILLPYMFRFLSIYMYHTHYTLNMICNHECIHVPFTTTSVITQSGETVLMIAVSEGRTEVVVELVKAKANLDLQNNVCHYSVYTCIYTRTL